jgi:hypothetical protein
MSVWRYKGTEWIELNSTVNISDGTVCARTLNFSFFALGLSVAAPDAEEAGLPATGGYSPGTAALTLILLAAWHCSRPVWWRLDEPEASAQFIRPISPHRLERDPTGRGSLSC